jgi:hypothetical protein
MAEINDNNMGQPESGGLGSTLKKFGLGENSIGNMNVQDAAAKAREYARSNPGKVLGGLSALVIGAGLLAKRGRR